MNCIIVEDQAPAQRVLQKYIRDIGTLQLVGTFGSAAEALVFLKQHEVDIIFLDIHLPGYSGMDFLKGLLHPPAVILTTAFSEYAAESYEMNVVDYLVKPFSFQRFLKAVNKVNLKTSTAGSIAQRPTEFFIKSGHEYIKVSSEEVLYIQSDMDYTMLHLEGKKLLSSETLQYWEQKLGKLHFMRVHKSYLINSTKIDKIGGNRVFLHTGTHVPIGRAYKEEFLKKVLQ